VARNVEQCGDRSRVARLTAGVPPPLCRVERELTLRFEGTFVIATRADDWVRRARARSWIDRRRGRDGPEVKGMPVHYGTWCSREERLQLRRGSLQGRLQQTVTVAHLDMREIAGVPIYSVVWLLSVVSNLARFAECVGVCVHRNVRFS